MAEKHFGISGVKALWEEALNTFLEDAQYQLDKAEIEDKIERIEANGYDDTQVTADIASLQAAMNNVDGKIDNKVTSAVSELVGGAPEAYNTLKEVADFISDHGAEAADLTGRVAALEEAKDVFLTSEEIKELCKKTTQEVVYGKYVVADASNILTAMANEGVSSITLDNDVDFGTNNIVINEGQNLVLDLNENKLELTTAGDAPAIYVNGGDLTIKGGNVEATKRIAAVSNGGKLTLENVTATSGDVAFSANGVGSELIVEAGTEIEAQECGGLVTTGAAFTMNGGTIVAKDNAAIMGNGTVAEGDDRGNVVINFNGGTLTGGIESAGYAACGIYMPNSGTLNVSGGTINVTNGCGILMRAGKLNMTAGTVTAVDNTGVEGGFIGKVGDSKVTVPCAAIVFDEKANYPGAANGEFGINISGGTLTSAEGLDDIVILSDNPENANVVDTRA